MPTVNDVLTLRPRDQVRWELVALGEVMLRLDPGDRRIHTTRSFDVWEGGGEYNVARGLRRAFGLPTAVVTALVDNPVGRLVEDLMLQGGVDLSYLQWIDDDGVGRKARNGLNFVERGYGVRAALGCSDRGHSAISQMKAGDVDWDRLFGSEGARWLHTGGIFCALSETTPDVALTAMRAARRHGAIVSYDLNYRPSLWKGLGGSTRAVEVNRSIVGLVDVLFGNEEDFSVALGFPVEGVDEHLTALDPANFKRMMGRVTDAFPTVKVIATTLRAATSATRNDWSAVCWSGGDFVQARQYPDLEIFDRVGGGDSFASGFIYGLLEGRGAQWALDCGTAHGALAMTTPGDTSMVTRAEVERVMKGGTARVSR